MRSEAEGMTDGVPRRHADGTLSMWAKINAYRALKV
jgi:hypothetical protein